jgi:hypothetical protein
LKLDRATAFATSEANILQYGTKMRSSYARFIVLAPLLLGACAYEAPVGYGYAPGVAPPGVAVGPVYADGYYGQGYADYDPAFVALDGGMWGGGYGGGGHYRGGGGHYRGGGGHWNGGGARGGVRGGVWHGGGGGAGGHGGGGGGGGHR